MLLIFNIKSKILYLDIVIQYIILIFKGNFNKIRVPIFLSGHLITKPLKIIKESLYENKAIKNLHYLKISGKIIEYCNTTLLIYY